MELVRVFFYGSFMNLDVLKSLGVRPAALIVAWLEHWDITLAPLATLVPSEKDRVFGILAELSRTDVEHLYSRDELKSYKSLEVSVETKDGKIPALCFISKPVSGSKPSAEYVNKIVDAAEALPLPQDYTDKLRRFLE